MKTYVQRFIYKPIIFAIFDCILVTVRNFIWEPCVHQHKFFHHIADTKQITPTIVNFKKITNRFAL